MVKSDFVEKSAGPHVVGDIRKELTGGKGLRQRMSEAPSSKRTEWRRIPPIPKEGFLGASATCVRMGVRYVRIDAGRRPSATSAFAAPSVAGLIALVG